MQEQKDSDTSTFLTLTYNDDHLPLLNPWTGEFTRGNQHAYIDTRLWKPILYKQDLVKYWKRLRKRSDAKIKYYAVGEYGERGNRPHYHAIVFNAEHENMENAWTIDDEEIGFTQCDEVTQASIRYVTKYCINQKDSRYSFAPPYATMSNGIGMGYIKRTKAFHQQKKDLYITNPGGYRQSMPRYYRERIFSEEELKEIAERVASENFDEPTWDEHQDYIKYYTTVVKQKSKSKTL